MNDNPPTLGEGPADHVSAVLRMGASAVPVVGGAFAELINRVIPSTRTDRIEDYLRWLTEKLQALSEQELRAKLSDPEKTFVFEQGAYQSARATTAERREQVASIVAEGIAGDENATIEARRLLSLIEQIDDAQVIMLASYLTRNMFDESFQERHRAVLVGPAAHLQSELSEIDREAVHNLAKSQLVSLGLLRMEFKKPKTGELPEFDTKTGMVKASGYNLTSLGRLLLRRLGLAADGEA